MALWRITDIGLFFTFLISTVSFKNVCFIKANSTLMEKCQLFETSGIKCKIVMKIYTMCLLVYVFYTYMYMYAYVQFTYIQIYKAGITDYM